MTRLRQRDEAQTVLMRCYAWIVRDGEQNSHDDRSKKVPVPVFGTGTVRCQDTCGVNLTVQQRLENILSAVELVIDQTLNMGLDRIWRTVVGQTGQDFFLRRRKADAFDILGILTEPCLTGEIAHITFATTEDFLDFVEYHDGLSFLFLLRGGEISLLP